MKILKKQGLTDKELEEIMHLGEQCNEADGIRLKLNKDMLKTRSTEETNDFLVYEEGELVGYLGMYLFDSTEAEINGMVLPRYRRRGIFSNLVKAAEEECGRRGIPRLLFICERTSDSGKAFLEKLGAAYSFSEYWMLAERDPDVTPVSSYTSPAGHRITLNKARLEDAEIVVELNRQGFEMSREDAENYALRMLDSDNNVTYVAEWEGRPIGKLGVIYEEEHVFINGFVVLQEYRGQGYGKQILTTLLARLGQEQGIRHFQLEVAVDNEKALGLYESCGFRTESSYDYYALEVHSPS